jgi:quinolinate synthase
MKRNTLAKLRDALDTLEPRIEMAEEVRARAELPIRRMLEWSR